MLSLFFFFINIDYNRNRMIRCILVGLGTYVSVVVILFGDTDISYSNVSMLTFCLREHISSRIVYACKLICRWGEIILGAKRTPAHMDECQSCRGGRME